MKKYFLYTCLSVLLFSVGCKKENNPLPEINSYAYIINEGGYGFSNGSISAYDKSTGIIHNDFFREKNVRTIGDVVQSFSIYNNKGYIVVNNSNKIEVVSYPGFISAGTITGFEFPISFLGINTKAYVTQLDGSVKVLNLTNNSISKTFSAGNGPDKMILLNSVIFINNKGGWGSDSTISVVDTENDSVIHTITVGNKPSDMVLDKNNKLWVLCMGTLAWTGSETPSELIQIDPADYSISYREKISDTLHPEKIGISSDGNYLYYGGGISFNGIMKLQKGTLTSAAVKLTDKIWYAFNIDPKTDDIYALDAGNWSSRGSMYIYSADGTELKSFETGIIPNGVVFTP